MRTSVNAGRTTEILRPAPPAIGAAAPIAILGRGVSRVRATEPEISSSIPRAVNPRSGGSGGDVGGHGGVGGHVSTDIDGDVRRRVEHGDIGDGRVGLDDVGVDDDRRVRNERRVLEHHVGLEGRVGGDDLDQHRGVGDGRLYLRHVGLRHGGVVGSRAVDGLRGGGAREQERGEGGGENDELAHETLHFLLAVNTSRDGLRLHVEPSTLSLYQ